MKQAKNSNTTCVHFLYLFILKIVTGRWTGMLVELVIRCIFQILSSTKTMIHESLSSHYISQIMLPILRSATRLSCVTSYMFWLLSSLTLSYRTIGRILFLFIWSLFKLSWSGTGTHRWFKKNVSKRRVWRYQRSNQINWVYIKLYWFYWRLDNKLCFLRFEQ